VHIKNIETFAVNVPMMEPFVTSTASTSCVISLIIKVVTDEGIEGVGEARIGYGTGFTHENIEAMKIIVDKYFGPALIGVNPLVINTAMDRVNAAWEAGYTITKAGIEMALYDIIAKHRKMSVSEVLGGVHHKKIGMVGSVSCGEPKAMAKKAASWVEKGYKVLKLKIGQGSDIDLDVRRVKEVREAVGPTIDLRLDCNSAYLANTALRFIKRVAPYDPFLLEDPVDRWNIDGMARVTRTSEIPICVDNMLFGPRDVFAALSRGAGHLIKIKLPRVGGFGNALKMIAIAEAAGISVVVGRGSTLSVAAAAEHHLIAVSKNVIPWGENTGPQKQEQDVVKEQPRITNGYVDYPEQFGLGVSLDMDKIRQYLIE
jgi:L-alanine-DL-glutamate epimerase-like enolase superfamily enzyme